MVVVEVLDQVAASCQPSSAVSDQDDAGRVSCLSDPCDEFGDVLGPSVEALERRRNREQEEVGFVGRAVDHGLALAVEPDDATEAKALRLEELRQARVFPGLRAASQAMEKENRRWNPATDAPIFCDWSTFRNQQDDDQDQAEQRRRHPDDHEQCTPLSADHA